MSSRDHTFVRRLTVVAVSIVVIEREVHARIGNKEAADTDDTTDTNTQRDYNKDHRWDRCDHTTVPRPVANKKGS